MYVRTLTDGRKLCKRARRLAGYFLDNDLRIEYDEDLGIYSIKKFVKEADTVNKFKPVFETTRQEEMAKWLLHKNFSEISNLALT